MATAAPQTPALEIKGLQAWYGESHVLHGVDIVVQPGEVVTLLGGGQVGPGRLAQVVHRENVRPERVFPLAVRNERAIEEILPVLHVKHREFSL